MKAKIIMGACALLVKLSSQDGGSSNWNYTFNGADWKDHECVKGEKQSPIDIPLFNYT
jgi:hypothetical protein